MNCESCGVETILCITALEADGSARTKWLCESCAIDAGAPILSGYTSPRALIPKLQRLSDVISRTGRFPVAGESDWSESILRSNNSDIAPSVACQYFNELIAFIAEHDRLPTESELPDRF